jgi:hypothetical protein
MLSASKRMSAAVAAASLLTVFSASGASATGCTLASLKGVYGVRLSGIVQVPKLPERKINAVATLTFNGVGGFNASFVGRINGDALTPSSITGGAYTVRSNCTGNIELTQIFKGFTGVQAAFVIVEQGAELFFVVNAAPPPANPAIIQVDGVAERGGSVL